MLKMRQIKQISIFGFADASRDDPLYKEAYEVAQVLAQQGIVVIDGGGPGVMRAASEGAKAVGGKTIGVTMYPEDIALFEGRDRENPLDQEIVTQNYLERTLKLLELGDAYIVFKGGTGTISEFGMAWGLARLYFGHHKPLILYGKFWEDIVAAFTHGMRMRPEELKVYRIATTPAEVLDTLEVFEEVLSHEEHIVSDGEKAFQL
ncbi:LOG family protein [Candidatus Microgenomates bacterium]|nr:LOG family protein [Candidatus Microgenomates bacterium]